MSSHPLYRMAAGIASLLLATTLATAAAAEITAKDLRGRTITLEAPAQRVVVTFNLEEVLAVLGPKAEGRIAAWSHGYWKGRRQWIWEKYAEALPWLTELPDVGYVGKKTFSVEKTVSLKAYAETSRRGATSIPQTTSGNTRWAVKSSGLPVRLAPL